MKITLKISCVSLLLLIILNSAYGYPVDGYETTGIRRLAAIELALAKKLSAPVPVVGGRKPTSEIKLNLLKSPGTDISSLPEPDAELQKSLDALFPNRDESYSVAVLDITPGQPIRFAARQMDRTFSPGSVGKLAIAAGLFAELKSLYPDSTSARQKLLRERMVVADRWIRSDHHKVPIYDPKTKKYTSRQIKEGDIFSLYEWADHALSASANAAASTVWKEAMLIRAFGKAYPPSREDEAAFFKNTSRANLQKISLSVINDPLREVGISKDDLRQGSFFTSAGKSIVPGTRSYGNPRGLLWLLVRIEQGKLVDEWSSLELKKLMYMTARRIRYASAPRLREAAVYFKSGSLYGCKSEPGFRCRKYMGNVKNYMNSVAIVEQTDGRIYLVALMSNVLKKNSAVDHQTLAKQIDQILER
ncbi:hypothetical protein ACFL6S_10185 [Candidatus Poribacteria bacterium]